MEETQLIIQKSTIQTIDNFKKKADNGADYWLARDLQVPLDYTKWDNFKKAIDRAKTSCKTLGIDPRYHFADISKMVDIGSAAQREREDGALTRYGSYL